MANPSPFQLRYEALQRRYGPITPAEQPTPLEAVFNRVWLASRSIQTRFDTQLFIYFILDNEIYGRQGFTHTVRLPLNSQVADEYAIAIEYALKDLPRDQRTALHTALPVLNKPADFQGLKVHYCDPAENPATANLERFIHDFNVYR